MRYSVPSYIIPGTYLENIRSIDSMEWVSNIELLFFGFDEESEKLLDNEITEIQLFKNRFSFSLHLPTIIESRTENLLEMTSDIVTQYVCHGDQKDNISNLNCYQKFADRILYENTKDYYPDEISCFDTGHILLQGKSPVDEYRKHIKNLREIHFHGTEGTRDHRIVHLETGSWLNEFFEEVLISFNGIFHIELFNEELVRKQYNILLKAGAVNE